MTERLRLLRKTLNMNQTIFARQLGITQTAYSMIENGRNPLKDKYIKVICLTFHVNERWLYTGQGSMFLSLSFEEEFMQIFDQLMPPSQEYLLHMAKDLLDTQRQLIKMAVSDTYVHKNRKS